MMILTSLRTHLSAFPPMLLPVLLAAAVISALLMAVSGFLGTLGLVLVGTMAAVYADPERAVPVLGPAGVIAPIDGRFVTGETPVGLPLAFEQAKDQQEHYTRLHLVQSFSGARTLRMPTDGTLVEILRLSNDPQEAAVDGGKPLTPWRDEVSLLIRGDNDVEYALVLQAPFVPRQIWLTVKEGDQLKAGDRMGLVLGWTTAELYVPANPPLRVAPTHHLYGGETVIQAARTQSRDDGDDALPPNTEQQAGPTFRNV